MQITLTEITGVERVYDMLDKTTARKTLCELLKPVNISFAIENCSRAATHVICETLDSYTQQSQRYVVMDKRGFVIPKELKGTAFEKEYVQLMKSLFLFYDEMTSAKEGEKRGRGAGRRSYVYGVPIEDGRYILPLSTTTNIFVTLSGRKLLNFVEVLQSRVPSECYDIADALVDELPVNLADRIADESERIDYEFVTNHYRGMFDAIDKDVVLFDRFEHPIERVALGGATSSQALPPSELLQKWTEGGIRERIASNITTRVLGYGHFSISEHARHVYGSEQSLTSYHQFERHRLCENIRECFEDIPVNRDVFVPPFIRENEALFNGYMDNVARVKRFRKRLLEAGNDAAAVYTLLNADGVKVITASNARIDVEMLKQRTCNNASWEIRDRANAIIDLMMPYAPEVYKYAGPPCTQGKCMEGDLSCGKASEMRQRYNAV